MKNVAVIGAGASGLFLIRKLAGDPTLQLYLFERSRNVGTKLRASGGGRANIFNKNISPLCYNNPETIEQLLSKVTPERMQSEFENLGLPVISDDEGRVYPLTQFSQTVVDILWNENMSNVHIETECEVKQLTANNGTWRVNDYPVLFDAVVVASGSPANMIQKNRLNYNGFLSPLKLKTKECQPSLVGFKIKDYPKRLSGCRTKAIASLYQNDTLIHREAGEVIFKDEGISGIVILNLSAFYNRLPSQKNCHISLNLMYQDEQFDVVSYQKRFHSMKGLLHPKLNEWYERNPFNVKDMRLEILSTYEMEQAQVCHGGVDVSEINDDFSAKRFQNLFFTGEILDIDGVCGGYNLFFAFASALVVSNAIKKSSAV